MRRLLLVVGLGCAALATAQVTVAGVPGELGSPEHRQAMRARASLAEVPPSSPGVGRRADSILSGEEFRDPGAARGRPLMEETGKAARSLGEKIGAGIQRILDRLFAGSGPAATVPVPPWAWMGVAVFIVAGLVIGYVWGARRHRVLADDLLDGDEGLSADAWLDKADLLESGGHHREAFRCIYVALLVRLAEHGVAPFRRYETNWEHVRRAEASPERVRGLDLRAPTRLFDSIWYGHKPVGAPEVAELRNLYLRAVQKLRGRAS